MKKLLFSSFLLVLSLCSNAQNFGKKSITLGTNWGYFDQFLGRGPVVFAEYNMQLLPFLQFSPHLLFANGTSKLVFINNDIEYLNYSSTTTFESGVVLKIIPFPKHFSGLKLIQGLTYMYENSLLTNTKGDPNYWNGHYLDKGLNYTFGADLELLRTKYFCTGVNLRMNTSPNRILLYHLGIVTNFRL